MGTNDGAIDEVERPIKLAVAVGLGLQLGKDALPDPSLAPAIVTAGDRAYWTIAFRQIWPGRTGA